MEVWGDTKQYTIFDYVSAGEAPKHKSIEELTEEEIAGLLLDYLGLKFNPHKTIENRWEYRSGKKVLVFSFGTYTPGSYKEGQRFISASYFDNAQGSSSPCDTLEDFLQRMKTLKDNYLQEGTQRNK